METENITTPPATDKSTTPTPNQLSYDSEAKNNVWDSLLQAVGPRYKAARLAKFECTHQGQKAAVDALQAYGDEFSDLRDQGGGIILTGPCGTGKDYLLVALAHEIIRQHCRGVEKRNSVYYGDIEIRPTFYFAAIDGMSLFSGLRSGMSQAHFDEDQYIESLVRADVLLLSDPAGPRGVLTDYQTGMLFRLVDDRYRSCRPTWVSLNVASATEAIERLTAPILDRLKHGALCISCNWPSYRKAEKNVM